MFEAETKLMKVAGKKYLKINLRNPEVTYKFA